VQLPPGHQTNPKPKGVGEKSMSGKAGCNETAKLHAGRGPDGMVKAGLLEPQCPICKGLGLDTAIDIQGFPRKTRIAWLRGEHAPRKQTRL
jgi:hypothetical protein